MKYKLRQDLKLEHQGRALYRIEALKDFSNIKKGDLGGYIEKEANLSQEGDCWVYDNAMVYGDAKVFGNALVSGNAKVFGDAWVSGNAYVFGNAQVYGDARIYDNAYVYGNAYVFGNAQVYGDAQVSGNAKVYGNAQVYGDAYVYGNAQVFGDAKVYGDAYVYGNAQVYGNAIITKTPKTITGLKHHITLTETHIFIGCEGHTIEHWKKNIVKIGKKHSYTDKEISQVIDLLKVLLRN